MHCVLDLFGRAGGVADDADPGVISCTGLMGSGSAVTPIVTNSPCGASPPTVPAMAWELPTVPRTTVAPPRACRAWETSPLEESM